MILPIITAVTREVFVQTPRGQIEAALALGATRWEVVRTTVLPFGMSGYISGADASASGVRSVRRSLWLIILRGTQNAFGWSLFDGGFTFASKIASAASEFNDQYKAGAYIAAGLVLFILTFVVNSLARAAGLRKGPVRIMAPHRRSEPAGRLVGRHLPGVSACAARSPTTFATVPGLPLSVVVALVPLVWVLCTVVAKGIGVVLDSTWWIELAGRASLAFQAGRRRLSRDRRLACCRAWSARSISGPDRRSSSVSTWSSTAADASWARQTTFMVDILTGVPSIVAALFIYAPVGARRWASERSGFAVSLALVLLMIPVIVRSTEEMLQDRPDGPARGRVTHWACRSGRPSRAIVVRRRCRHRHRHPAGAGPRHG